MNKEEGGSTAESSDTFTSVTAESPSKKNSDVRN
jgi:hypothetical protein